MTRTGTCSRLWQARTLEDEPLDGPERLSFEKHARTCSICAREIEALAALRETMLRIPPLSSTPLEHRRLRAALLQRANARAVSHSGMAAWRRLGWIAAPVSLGALAMIVLMLLGRSRSAPSSHEAAPGPPSFDVDSVEGTEWTSEVTGSAIHARLAAGAASFHVEHTRSGQRFLLQMPDAQIEVHGTRFRVEVRRGTTNHVDVSEGVVTLRLQGKPERWLRAGETWDAAPHEATTDPRPIAPPDAIDEAKGAPAGSADAREPPGRSGTTSAPDARSMAPQRDAFAAAVATFRRGNYRRAEQMLDRFLSESPRDARVEDAWFMKAVARSRAGDTEGAARLAQAYLDRFPNGLRRREAERISVMKTVDAVP